MWNYFLINQCVEKKTNEDRQTNELMVFYFNWERLESFFNWLQQHSSSGLASIKGLFFFWVSIVINYYTIKSIVEEKKLVSIRYIVQVDSIYILSLMDFNYQNYWS